MTLKGKSGQTYEFECWPMDQSFNAVGAVYAVTRRYQDDNGNWKHKVLYVGETGDLSTRFDDHHKADCFANNKANRICTHLEDDEDSRLAIEDDLIKQYDPPCNG